MERILDYLYPVSYLISLVSLVMWFFAQSRPGLSRGFSLLFLAGFFVYLFSLSWSSGSIGYKLLILFRDVAVMTIFSQVFIIAGRRILLSAVLGLTAAAVVYFSYFNVLYFTFPQLKLDDVDPAAEFLLALEHPEDLAQLEGRMAGQISVSPAFTMEERDHTILDNYVIVDVLEDETSNRKSLYKRLRASDVVTWIEPNEIIPLEEPMQGSLDSKLKKKPFLNDPGIVNQWFFEALELNALHEMLIKSGLKPGKKARIAIIDTGVDSRHEDLNDNYTSINSSSDSDNQGHGTHCAGIAAAVSNNGIGIASTAPSSDYVTVSGLRVTNSMGIITQRAIIQALIDASDSGADVLSLSLGGRSNQDKQKAYGEAVRYANSKGAIVVVAAGNASENAKHTAPANTQGVIAVSALDEDLDKAEFSNSVEDLKMGLAAPGVNIYSTLPGNRYASMNGTSMATPMVAGAIALMKAFYPEMTTKEAYYLLDRTGKSTSAGSASGNLIQPYAALREILD